MADAATILELREMINEPNVAPWTDEVLSARIDNWDGTLDLLAARIWKQKAASLSGLIDVKEGNSDRKMSQLYKQALEMSASFGGVEAEASTRRPARTRPIERM